MMIKMILIRLPISLQCESERRFNAILWFEEQVRLTFSGLEIEKESYDKTRFIAKTEMIVSTWFTLRVMFITCNEATLHVLVRKYVKKTNLSQIKVEFSFMQHFRSIGNPMISTFKPLKWLCLNKLRIKIILFEKHTFSELWSKLAKSVSHQRMTAYTLALVHL